MKTALIIDDETKARQLLKAMLADCAPDIQVVADCDDLPGGVKAIRRFKPDLVFLDIEMPGHSGLELMDFFDEREVTFFVIFTTAYSQYAIQAFRVSAIDYLLKPLSYEALAGAVERFRHKKEYEARQLLALQLNTGSPRTPRLALPQANGIRFVDSHEILYAEGDGAYTTIFLADGEKLLISRNLKYLETMVEGIPDLMRCHKSYLVNVAVIAAYIRQDGGYLRLTNGRTISISPDKVEQVLLACEGRQRT